MTNEPLIAIGYTSYFKRDLKRLKKKYPKIDDDTDSFVHRLQSGETLGTQIPGIGYTVYKARVKSSDLTKGKSSGYRLIYYLKTPKNIVLLSIYLKTEQVDMRPERIRYIIENE